MLLTNAQAFLNRGYQFVCVERFAVVSGSSAYYALFSRRLVVDPSHNAVHRGFQCHWFLHGFLLHLEDPALGLPVAVSFVCFPDCSQFLGDCTKHSADSSGRVPVFAEQLSELSVVRFGCDMVWFVSFELGFNLPQDVFWALTYEERVVVCYNCGDARQLL